MGEELQAHRKRSATSSGDGHRKRRPIFSMGIDFQFSSFQFFYGNGFPIDFLENLNVKLPLKILVTKAPNHQVLLKVDPDNVAGPPATRKCLLTYSAHVPKIVQFNSYG